MLNNANLVNIKTSEGDFIIELYFRHQPELCTIFKELIKNKLYNRAKLCRIIEDESIVFSPMNIIHTHNCLDFIDKKQEVCANDLNFTGAGVVALLISTTQKLNKYSLLISCKPILEKNDNYVIIGRIHTGMGLIKKISLIPCASNGVPLRDVAIFKSSITEAV